MARGFFAELQYQSQLAAKRNEQAARAAHRANLAAHREAERAQKAAERAAAQRARATATEQKAADREAKRLHEEAMVAETAAKNAELAKVHDEIDSILSATLGRDDYVDLNSLRAIAEHPPFPREDLEAPVPPPTLTVGPPEPTYVEPESPRGLGAVFGGKKKHNELVAKRRAEYEADHHAWETEVAALPSVHLREMQEHEKKEQQRLAALSEVRHQYEAECEQRETVAAETNRRLDELIAGIEYNVEDAIQQYVSIVLGNSVYPDSIPIEHDFEFDAALKELSLTVVMPPAADFPAEKEFKYVRAKDQISPTMLPKKNQKERYNNAVFQVALRSLHEIFEADRAGRIQTIAIKVCAVGTDPPTGVEKRSVLVAAAAEREKFMTFDLANVVPEATLEHLGALVSKNPFDMIEVDGSQGVRGR
ncbi:MAG: hypothetical protein H0U53_05835 [Actinobacteria bacterium]|nr:hypothetical protein [Actinomycetota bacterium]